MSQLIGLYKDKNCYAISMDAYIDGAFYNIGQFAYIIIENGAVMDNGELVGWYDGEAIHTNLKGKEKDYQLLLDLVKKGKESKE